MAANYSYVIDSSYNPFSMQEMLVPLTMYKEAYEKSEEQYMDLSDKADKFKYLSKNLPEGSAARKIYEGYAGELNKQAEDLAHNGLTMGNRRALTSLRRRYSGEIGRLALADEAMREEKKLRQTLNAQDSSRLYAEDNLNIDQFLDGNNPNLYNISGNELYTRGATAGKAASSRIFKTGDGGSTLGGYYRDWVQKMGYSAESINAFRQNASAIPELQAAADAILEERGVNQNLTGINLQRARQSVINGIIDGAVYQEQHSPQRDLGVMTAAEKSDAALRQQSLNLQAAAQRDSHEEHNIKMQMLRKQLNGEKSSGKGSGEYVSQLSNGVKLTFKGKTEGTLGTDYTYDSEDIDTSKKGRKHVGNSVTYDDLPADLRAAVVDKIVGNGGDPTEYDYWYKPYEKGRIWDTQAELEIIPRNVHKTDSDTEIATNIH